MQGWEKLMNGRLKGRLDNWVKTLSSKEIDADVLRKMLSNNKEYSTPTQYNNAFSYLRSLGYIIHDDEIEVVKDYVPEENIESEDEFFSNDDEGVNIWSNPDYPQFLENDIDGQKLLPQK